MTKPYIFYFDTPYGLVEFPITPGALKITTESNNDVVTLITEGDVNILKSPSLIEVEFEARFPTHKYPYSTTPDNISEYHSIFTKLMEEKKPFKFIVARTNKAETSTGNTRFLMALEELATNEDADEGDDVLYTFKLKQYKPYGVVILPNSNGTNTTSTADKSRNSNSKDTGQQDYTVKSGDCLWNIAKAAYGDGSKWTVIYNANKDTIESAAKNNGKNSSSNGHWIYPGTKLTIPGLTNANLTVQKLKNKSSTGGGSTNGGGSGRYRVGGFNEAQQAVNKNFELKRGTSRLNKNGYYVTGDSGEILL